MGGLGEVIGGLGWPSFGARGGRSTLLLFRRIHCGAVSVERDKCMTPGVGALLVLSGTQPGCFCCCCFFSHSLA